MIASSIRTVVVLIATTALATAACSSNTPSSLTTPSNTSSPTQAVTSPALVATQTPTASAVTAIGTWSQAGSMATARAEHTATLLPNGKVLVAGGVADNNEAVALASAELYDPSTGTWSATGAMTTPRSQHTATLLANGKVLVTGGLLTDGVTSSAVLYDPDPKN